jgi:hypothetical protein
MAVAARPMPHLSKITAAFEFLVLALTVPGLRAENIKILCTFDQLHHSTPPYLLFLGECYRFVDANQNNNL